MSLLDFPPEVTLQFLRKMNSFDRINLSIAHPSLSPLCFDKSLFRKSKGTITIHELHRLYQQSCTEEERRLCFSPHILDRLRIKNFNEVVHLYNGPDSDRFVSELKVLQLLKGKIVLEGENEPFSMNFLEKFIYLLDSVEGNLLLVFIDVISIRKMNAKIFADIISRKWERGEKVYFIDVGTKIGNSHAWEIMPFMNNTLTLSFESHLYKSHSNHGKTRIQYLNLEKMNSVENTKVLVDMIDEDNLIEVKQHLVKVLPVLETAQLQGACNI